jgi:hypothetical protein
VGLYVETLVRADLAEVWRRTQDPGEHERWDLRFTRIRYLPDDGGPRRFRYSTRILPGLVIAGTGTTVAERYRPDGTRTSALRFASANPLSLIREGAGYWRYAPTGAGVRFVTGYDYRPGWGRLGALVDRVFRPLLGWATAWSFDRLRLWLERGIDPRHLLWHGLAEFGVRASIPLAALAWAGWWPASATAAAALLLPPAPTTPAARRCRRRPIDRRQAVAPSTLHTLQAP